MRNTRASPQFWSPVHPKYLSEYGYAQPILYFLAQIADVFVDRLTAAAGAHAACREASPDVDSS